jgi:hypothetical protein
MSLFGDNQVLNLPALKQVFFGNSAEIFLMVVMVECSFRINNQRRSSAADIEASGTLNPDFPVGTGGSDFFSQKLNSLHAGIFSAAFFSFCLLVGTDKYMAIVVHRLILILCCK